MLQLLSCYFYLCAAHSREQCVPVASQNEGYIEPVSVYTTRSKSIRESFLWKWSLLWCPNRWVSLHETPLDHLLSSRDQSCRWKPVLRQKLLRNGWDHLTKPLAGGGNELQTFPSRRFYFYISKKIFQFLFLCLWGFCCLVYLCVTCTPDTWTGQKKILDSLELKLEGCELLCVCGWNWT